MGGRNYSRSDELVTSIGFPRVTSFHLQESMTVRGGGVGMFSVRGYMQSRTSPRLDNVIEPH